MPAYDFKLALTRSVPAPNSSVVLTQPRVPAMRAESSDLALKMPSD